MANQNAKLKLTFYVKLLTSFSNMPVNWPLKSYWAGMGGDIHHGLNGFPQNENKVLGHD